jgi:hypothetical protein
MIGYRRGVAKMMVERGRSYIWFLGGLLVIAVGFWPSFYGDPPVRFP